MSAEQILPKGYAAKLALAVGAKWVAFVAEDGETMTADLMTGYSSLANSMPGVTVVEVPGHSKTARAIRIDGIWRLSDADNLSKVSRAQRDAIALTERAAEIYEDGRKAVGVAGNADEPEPQIFKHRVLASHVAVRDRNVAIDGVGLGILSTDEISTLFVAQKERRLWIDFVESET